jgi:hypothetical protein
MSQYDSNPSQIFKMQNKITRNSIWLGSKCMMYILLAGVVTFKKEEETYIPG